jgi:hypothetical protein
LVGNCERYDSTDVYRLAGLSLVHGEEEGIWKRVGFWRVCAGWPRYEDADLPDPSEEDTADVGEAGGNLSAEKSAMETDTQEEEYVPLFLRVPGIYVEKLALV